jgi:immunity protein 40 of polymorphic toxin system
MHSNGVAFTRADILEALESLKGTQAGVMGGDVLKIVDGKLRYTYDSWRADKKSEENIPGYLARSIEEDDRYIRNYPDPEDGTILYSPTISELGLP